MGLGFFLWSQSDARVENNHICTDITTSKLRSRTQCIIHELHYHLRTAIGALVAIPAMSIIMDRPDPINLLLLEPRAPEPQRSQAHAMANDAEMLDALPAGKRWM